MIVGDIETDGLNPTVIHCAVFYNTETKDWTVFTPEDMEKLRPWLETVDNLVMHNGIGFDLKVFRKLLCFDYDKNYGDTLLMSRILWPDIEHASYFDEKGAKITIRGPHSLAAWGTRLGIKKPEHEDWSVYSEDMLRRCREDVKITVALLEKIQREIKMIGFRTYQQVFRMESDVWRIIEQQSDNGWKFDKEKAERLVKALDIKMEKVEKELDKHLPYRLLKPSGERVCKAFKKDGELTKNCLNWVWDRKDEVCGDFCKVKFEKVEIGSPVQLKEFLLSNGWEPEEWNYKKDRFNKVMKENGKPVQLSPKLPNDPEGWDLVKKSVKIDSIDQISVYKKCSHRRGQVQGFLDKLRPNGRIPAKAHTCSTNTSRMVHRVVVNVPKANDDVFLGKHMRSLFIVPEGRVLVGFDASALEARVQAHYVYPYDPDMARELIEGDIHSKNAEIFNIDRNLAKGAYYAILYGSSAFKFATMIGADVKNAKRLYNEFWDKNVGLKIIKENLENEHSKSGLIKAIDGRPLTVRYKHALINTLFQSCGSIIMKKFLVLLDKSLKSANIPYKFVGNFHDEVQIETYPEVADEVGHLAEAMIQEAAKSLKINVPIIGEYKVGHNWAETH